MKIKPTPGKVIIQKEEEDKVTKSGIILTPDNKEKKGVGYIYSVPDGINTLKKGDKVVFVDYLPDLINEEERLYVISEENILAIIHD